MTEMKPVVESPEGTEEELSTNKVQLPEQVIVHPLVLLSAVDHYSRVANNSSKARVVGVLLGSRQGNTIDVSNSFAVPFEEDRHDPSVWFIDHNYLEDMFHMFKKVNAKEKIIGWYSTGPKLRVNDLEINELFKRYTSKPLFCIIDVKPHDNKLPTDAYIAIEEIHDDGTPTTKTFAHVQSIIGAEEAEEIGVEHMLRDIKDTGSGTLAQKVISQINAVQGLLSKLREMHSYLQDVVDNKMPVNNAIIYQMQDIFNCLPNLHVQESIEAFANSSNDQLHIIFLASLVRTVIALHDLINNKIDNLDAERKESNKLKDLTTKKESNEAVEVAASGTQ